MLRLKGEVWGDRPTQEKIAIFGNGPCLSDVEGLDLRDSHFCLSMNGACRVVNCHAVLFCTRRAISKHWESVTPDQLPLILTHKWLQWSYYVDRGEDYDGNPLDIEKARAFLDRADFVPIDGNAHGLDGEDMTLAYALVYAHLMGFHEVDVYGVDFWPRESEAEYWDARSKHENTDGYFGQAYYAEKVIDMYGLRVINGCPSSRWDVGKQITGEVHAGLPVS